MDFVYTSVKGEGYKALIPDEINKIQNTILLGAVDKKGIPSGVIVARLVDYSYEIIWLYVRPKARRNGVASGLVKELLYVIRKTGQIYPVSLIYNSGSEDIFWFMSSLKCFDNSFVGRRFFVDSKRLHNSSMVNQLKEYKAKENALFFEQLEAKLNYIYRKVYDMGIDLQGLIRRTEDSLIKEMCLCHVGNNKIDSIVLTRTISDKELEIIFSYAENKVAFIYIIIEIFKIIEKKYKNAALTIMSLNSSSELLIMHLFGNDTPCEIILRGEWNYMIE